MEPMQVDDVETDDPEEWMESSDINHLLFLDNVLPDWKTKIISVATNSKNLVRVKFALAAKTKEEIKTWLSEFEEKTSSTYSIKTTTKCTGRILNFKQRLQCHHNTRNSKLYSPAIKNRTKNTNCPSRMNIALHAVKKRHRSKYKDKIVDPEMPCVITLITSHNHPTYSNDILRFRKVSSETKTRLLELYKNGHTAATALELLKLDIRLEPENYQERLADRKYCPSYNNIYYLYKERFKKKFGPPECEIARREYLVKRVDSFNQSIGIDSAKLGFHESGFAICICPPIFRRMHQYISAASHLVFIDSSHTAEPKGSCMFVFSTESECGTIPLGAIVTSSQNEQLFTLGFELLQNMLGDTIFGGNTNGPCVFLTADSELERIAISNVWKNSTLLLCTFHVLQTVWKWLFKPRNGIAVQDQPFLFHQFRTIAYAKSVEKCYDAYKLAKLMGNKYPVYLEYLKDYWTRKELWALCYRNKSLDNDFITKKSEAAKRILKEKLFESVKAFNMIQIIDFLLTQFPKYYEHLLLYAFRNQLNKEIKQPPLELLDQIKQITGCIFLVPSENHDIHYIVNTDVLLCSCTQTKFCDHIDWACCKDGQFVMNIDDEALCKKFYFIATGKKLPGESVYEIHSYCKVDAPTGTATLGTTDIVQNNNLNDEESETTIIYINTEDIDDPGNYPETALQRGKKVIEEINTTLARYLDESPADVLPALELFSVTLRSVETKEELVNRLSNLVTGEGRLE